MRPTNGSVLGGIMGGAGGGEGGQSDFFLRMELLTTTRWERPGFCCAYSPCAVLSL